MIAVDTNVVVRVLVNDDPAQAKRAFGVFLAGRVWISKTVLLETAWVLRFTYELEETAIASAFAKLLGVATVDVENRDAVERALNWYGQGLDFADALHLASSAGAKSFASFDRRLSKSAARAGTAPPVVAP